MRRPWSWNRSGQEWCGTILVPLVHHQPAIILEDGFISLIGTDRLDPHDAGLAIAVFLFANHLRDGPKRVAWINGTEETHACISEIRHRVERDIVHRFAEHDVKDEQIVDGLSLVTE